MLKSKDTETATRGVLSKKLAVKLFKAAVSWKFSNCSVNTSLKIWWIIMHEH